MKKKYRKPVMSKKEKNRLQATACGRCGSTCGRLVASF